MNRLLAETLGTYGLVFAGCGAMVIDHATAGSVTHVGVAITFGLVVLAMIHTFGDVSGAHLNPAVTTAFAAAGRFPWREVPAYVVAQLSGAFLACATLRVLFPGDRVLGATVPTGPDLQSVVLEVVLTFFLMMTVLSVSTGAKEKDITAGMAIASVVTLEAMFAGPVSGASMNPARSLAPAIVGGDPAALRSVWIYLVAPLLGALLAVPACRRVRGPGCCDGRCGPHLSPTTT